MAELFLSHNKHVLVEKTRVFTNLADWLAMKALRQTWGVVVGSDENRAFPAYRDLKSYLSENNIQAISIEAGFGNEHDYDPYLFIFNPELSGGADT
ncbi:hypothetical protein O9993_19440 [Vibrio lentus]|nr:hypothetical protein [Vibrio lentus]